MIHKKTTVLVAEDEQAMARLLKSGLQHEGYHVLTARDRAEAINVYDCHQRD